MGFSRQEYWSGLPFPSCLHGAKNLSLRGFHQGVDSIDSYLSPGLLENCLFSRCHIPFWIASLYSTKICLFIFLIGVYLLYMEKEMATYSSTLAWKIPWMEELVGYSPWGRWALDTTERWHMSTLQYHVSFCCKTKWVSHTYTDMYMYIAGMFISYTYISLTSPIPLLESSQSTKMSFLRSTAASHELSVLHMVVYLSQCYSRSPILPFPALCPHVHPLCLCLYSCPGNRFICTTFLDSTYTLSYMKFVFLFLT